MDKPLGALDGVLGLHLRLAHGAVQRHFTEHFSDLGLTQKQISVLWLAGDQPGIAQADLARRLRMDRATTMTIVHALERRGLLARARAADARLVALSPTPAGTVMLNAARVAIAEHEKWLHAQFTVAEARTLETLLRRLHG